MSVFSTEDLNDIPQPTAQFNRPENEKLNNMVITRENVLNEINRLKPNKSPGPDNIYPKVLKECKEELRLLWGNF